MRGLFRTSLALFALCAASAPPAAALAPPAMAAQAPSIPRAGEARGARDTVEALRHDARSKASARRFADAIADYERLLALAPGDGDALAHLAQLQAWTGDYDQAIVHYRVAIAAHPLDPSLES